MQTPDRARQSLRVGVCGSGHWARTVHLPGLAATPGIDLVGLWGRRPEQGREVAAEFGIQAFDDFQDLLHQVDAVSFALPPDTQASMALKAADAGKHLLLEKPIATALSEADRLVEVVTRRGLSAVVFLTRCFVDDAHELIARARAGNHTRCEMSWSSKALLPGTPFTASAWRNSEYGTLWDLGPHVLSILVPVFGPVTAIAASRIRKAKFTSSLHHAGGAKSTMVLDQMDETLTSPGSRERYLFSGGDGVTEGGGFRSEPVRCFSLGASLLLETPAAALDPYGPNIRFGRDIVAVLDAARRSIDAGGELVDVRY